MPSKTFQPIYDGYAGMWKDGLTRTQYDACRDSVASREHFFDIDYMTVGQWIIMDGYEILRGYLHFDTSELPDDAIITYAELRLKCLGTDSTVDTPVFDLVIQHGLTPEFPHMPYGAGVDFDRTQYGGDGGRISTTKLPGLQPMFPTDIVIPLTAEGISWINKLGNTKVILRTSPDIDGIMPTTSEWANFATTESANPPELYVEYIVEHELTITSSLGGTTKPVPGVYSYEEGSNVPVEAIADSGFIFDHWELDGVNVGTALTYTVLMDTMHTLHAVFVTAPPTPQHALSVSSSPTGVEFLINTTPYTTPVTVTLDEGTYLLTAPSSVTIDTTSYTFKEWEDGSSNPERTIDLYSDVSVSFTLEAVSPPPPEKGHLEVHAFINSTDIEADGTVEETGTTFKTPTVPPLELDPGSYTITCTYQGQTQTKTTTVTEGTTIRLDFQFTPTPLFPRLREKLYPILPGPFDRFDAWRGGKPIIGTRLKGIRRRG